MDSHRKTARCQEAVVDHLLEGTNICQRRHPTEGDTHRPGRAAVDEVLLVATTLS